MKYFYTKHKKNNWFTRLVDFGFVFEIVRDNFYRLFCKIDKSITLDSFKSKTVKISKPKFTTGFTLIELLTVIAIIGFISAIVYANLHDARKRAQETKIVQEIDQLSKAFELFKTDKGTYPGEDESSVLGNGVSYLNDGVIDFLNNNLVELKYISAIPQYGANTDILDSDAKDYRYYSGTAYLVIDKKPIRCGDKIVSNYVFIFENLDLDLSFPRLVIDESSVVSGYCIGQ